MPQLQVLLSRRTQFAVFFPGNGRKTIAGYSVAPIHGEMARLSRPIFSLPHAVIHLSANRAQRGATTLKWPLPQTVIILVRRSSIIYVKTWNFSGRKFCSHDLYHLAASQRFKFQPCHCRCAPKNFSNSTFLSSISWLAQMCAFS